ncbi:alpha-L-rhamnosidase C-terminal domain-containing protein [Chitinophaga sp. XS-30]|uniref:alpha-L-rhamnosidase-related protein n=1 Tax=Chitinophaga sp. XS-30 TaxID=2604421 RepID=UPI0011DE02EE|nr:alpha-L-rhamnosidase C-terminal domain-containing protein [Chitinophaga sp. XS-30]QEH42293.1 Bacterial alpha-L-rhamnosidase [Chitinophaga sp. XS-30]
MKQSLLFPLLLIATGLSAQKLPPVFSAGTQAYTPELTRTWLSPVRIVMESGMANARNLLVKRNGQADLSNRDICTLEKAGAYIMLDFGREIHGGIQIVTGVYKGNKPAKVRVRFGESVSEAMSDIGGEKNATNDHAMRDMIVEVPWLGSLELGNTGFRFVRIDLVEENMALQLKEINAVLIYRDLPYKGSFRCSDTLLNTIWLTGAYTVQLNMQDYLWDGIKRDRLVWVGDLHPEVSTICAVFGEQNVVPKSLDLARDITPLPQYMNGIGAYSMWWVLLHRDWYLHTGNIQYLREQSSYLKGLLNMLITKIGPDNREKLDGGMRFLDWPSSGNEPAIHAGLQAMMVMTLHAGAELSKVLGDAETATQCTEAATRLQQHVPDPNGSKQAAAMLALSGLASAEKMNNEVIGKDSTKHYSTFFGYYMLQAKAKAGDYAGALRDIRQYWGAMLALGATTFWEDFNMDWIPDASRIDEVVPEGMKDIHGDYGAHCYIGLRHSLCHGWASGPTAWLTEHVLGIKVTAPGCRTIEIEPHLGDLDFAEGTFPTPYGIVSVKHTRMANGKVRSTVKGPKEVKIILSK